MSTPRALVIRTAGTNCDAEMCRAFEMAGAGVDLIHVDRLIADARRIDRYDLIGFPGGFSYGDDIASGRILAMKLREKLYPALRNAARRGCPMIGACNGFQVLVQVGLLPGPGAGTAWPEDEAPTQTTSLSFNAGGRFIDAWIRVEPTPGSCCVWTQGLAEEFRTRSDAVLRLPVAHGEGRFVVSDAAVLQDLARNRQIAMTYVDNPNGSTESIAGICDTSGRIFGLMPHPERYLEWTRHPFWTRLPEETRSGQTPGLMMFRNAVHAAAGVGA